MAARSKRKGMQKRGFVKLRKDTQHLLCESRMDSNRYVAVVLHLALQEFSYGIFCSLRASI